MSAGNGKVSGIHPSPDHGVISATTVSLHTYVGGICTMCGEHDPTPPIEPDSAITDEQAITDHPALHAIQMAYSAMERALELSPGNPRHPGLVEVEKWLSDATSAVAALRESDRAEYEARRAEDEARPVRPYDLEKEP